ncbi:RNA polymerase sigma factor [soil metagenome]
MEEAPFLAAVNEHQAIIHKICRLYRNTPEDREDLFQEIVFQLWKSYPAFENRSKFSTWIYRIALNTAMASFRKKQPLIVFTETLPDHLSGNANQPQETQQDKLFEALGKLADAEKAIMALYLEGLDYKEMAEILGISENYVGVKLNRIKNQLQQLLK